MALIIGFGLNAKAQVNLKVGYNMAYIDLKETKIIFDSFNEANPQAEQQLKPPQFNHGIELGLRYKFGNFALDAGLTSASGKSEAINVFQSNGSLGNDEWRISLTNYSLGFETFFGNMGFGATLGTQKLKYRTDLSSSDGKKTVFEESVLNSKFYFLIEVPSKAISFSIRPYIGTTWSPYNIKELDLVVNPQSTTPKSEFDQDVLIYGFSFLFYNGPQ